MTSKAAAAMYPDLAKRDGPSEKGQKKRWRVSAADAVCGKKTEPPPKRRMVKVPMTVETLSRVPGLKPKQ